MIEQLTKVMVQSGATWVLWLLFALSFVCVAISLERALVFRGTSGDVRTLVAELRKTLRLGRGAESQLAASSLPAAKVVLAGVAERDRGSEAAEEAMAAAMGLERARLEKRLLFLGTVGN